MVKRIEDAMKLLDIAGLKDRNPFDLSGGQMQRVAIASILVMQPEIMIRMNRLHSLILREQKKYSRLWRSW